MNIETLVLLGVAYAIGFYITAFVMGMINANIGMEFDCADWFIWICWPICIPIFIMVELVALCELAFAKMRDKFPTTVRFIQRTLKCAKTVIFAVSLLFRPAKFGEIVSKRLDKNKGKGYILKLAMTKDHCHSRCFF